MTSVGVGILGLRVRPDEQETVRLATIAWMLLILKTLSHVLGPNSPAGLRLVYVSKRNQLFSTGVFASQNAIYGVPNMEHAAIVM